MVVEAEASSCQDLVDAFNTYWAVATASFFYTCTVVIVVLLCLNSETAPRRVGRPCFWISIAAPKIIVAVLLLTALMPPGCSEACPCEQSPGAYYVYPSVSLLICTRWLLMATKAAAANAPGGGDVDLPSYYVKIPTALEERQPPSSSPLARSSGEMA
jgi:hypothetical protein